VKLSANSEGTLEPAQQRLELVLVEDALELAPQARTTSRTAADCFSASTSAWVNPKPVRAASKASRVALVTADHCVSSAASGTGRTVTVGQDGGVVEQVGEDEEIVVQHRPVLRSWSGATQHSFSPRAALGVTMLTILGNQAPRAFLTEGQR
jgi:hypothetical protein